MTRFLGRVLGGLAALLVAVRTVLARVRRRRPETPETMPPATQAGGTSGSDSGEDPSERTVPADRGAEALVALLLLAAAVFGFAFVALFVVDGLNTQLLGLAFGLMLAMFAAAAIIAGKRVVPQETAVEEREALVREGEPEELVQMIAEGGEGVSRRALLAGAGGVAGVALVSAAAAPVASLGPRLTSIHAVPWRRGVRMVDESGKPYAASEIEIGSFYTALPEGADWEQMGAPLLVVKLPANYIRLPEARRDWAPQGILAFSKICPHAACAISLYRYPTYGPTSGVAPAFTCPCHYSTFLPGEGGRLIFGPAGRPLPQLPVMIDADGNLRAGGGFDEDIGPSWIDVRRVGFKE